MEIDKENKKNYMCLPRYLTDCNLSLLAMGMLLKLVLKAVYYWDNPDFGIIKSDFKTLYTKLNI